MGGMYCKDFGFVLSTDQHSTKYRDGHKKSSVWYFSGTKYIKYICSENNIMKFTGAQRKTVIAAYCILKF